MVTYLPVLLLGLPPIMKTKHDGEGAGRQHLLIVVVVKTVSRCQSKSVSNLGGKQQKLENVNVMVSIFIYRAIKTTDEVLTSAALHLLLI